MYSFKEAPNPINFEYVKDFLEKVDKYYGSYGIYDANDPAYVLHTDEFASKLALLNPKDAAELCGKVWELKHGDALVERSLGALHSEPLPFHVKVGPNFSQWLDAFEKVVDEKIEF